MRSRTGFAGLIPLILIGITVACYLAVRSGVGREHRFASSVALPITQVPLCGQLNDERIHIPPDWGTFKPLPVGQSYVDPAFGCPVKRLTDGATEEVQGGSHLSFLHYYSTFSPVNATDTRILIYANDGAWRIKDLDGRVAVPASKMPRMNNGHPVWDASDGNAFYYALDNALHKAVISGNSVKNTALYTFKEYSSIVSPDAADLSEDGDHIALVGKNSNATMDVFVWSLGKQTKTSTYTTACKVDGDIATTPQPGCVHKLLLTADNLLSIQFSADGQGQEEGARLWTGASLIHLQDATNHYDTGYDLSGKPIFIAVGNSRTLASLKNGCPSGWGLDVRQQSDISSAACLLDRQPAWHVSYRGGPSQPWMALSFFDDRRPGPELFGSDKDFREPSSANWLLYEDELLLARVDGTAIYRLAHSRSRSAENYWATPRAAISRDGKYVIFGSNMAYPNGCPERTRVKNECMDVYAIKVF